MSPTDITEDHGGSARAAMPVPLLWTGGWDSTFRLLDLASRHRCTIQPYYVIDRCRPAWSAEIEAMRRIGEARLADGAKYPAGVLPLIIIEKDSIALCPEISASFDRFRRREPEAGPQWGWLACLARELGLRLELGLQGMRTPGPVYRSVQPYVEPCEGPWGRTHVLRRHPDPDILAVFRHFTYPILHLTKVDIEGIARERGFLELLELSCFCHRSTTGRPCGICSPCQYAIREGLGRRVGWLGSLKYHTIARVDEALPPAARAVIRKARLKVGRAWLAALR